MSNPNDIRAELVETIYEKTSVPGAWKPRDKESFEVNLGDLRITLERGTLGDRVAYSVWIWGREGLVDRIYDDDLEGMTPRDARFKTYEDMIRHMHRAAGDVIAIKKLTGALEKLKNAELNDGKE